MRGDVQCSRDCEKKEGIPALSVNRNGDIFEIRQCPYKQITRSATAFILDLQKVKGGVISPFTRSEYPAKYEAFLDLYESWLAFFQKRKAQRDQPNDGLSEIQKYRAGKR